MQEGGTVCYIVYLLLSLFLLLVLFKAFNERVELLHGWSGQEYLVLLLIDKSPVLHYFEDFGVIFM